MSCAKLLRDWCAIHHALEKVVGEGDKHKSFMHETEGRLRRWIVHKCKKQIP